MALGGDVPNGWIPRWYRLLCQIELAFKRMKSLMNFGQRPKRVAQSSRAWLHGKLLVALLTERLIEVADLRFTWSPPPSGCPDDSRLRVVEHARHTC